MGSNTLGYFNEVLAGALVPVFGEKLTGLAGPLIPLFLNIVIILLVLTGLALSLKKPELLDVYCIFYLLAILAFWNPRVGSVKARFLIPILPFLYLYLILGSKWVLQKLTGNNPVPTLRLLGTTAGIILLLCLARNLLDWRNPVREQMTDLSIGTEWISRNAPPDAIIMVNEPVPAYLYTRRKTVSYPDKGQDIEKYLDNQGIDYIVISPMLQSPRTTALDGFSESKLLPFLRSNPDQFTPVYSNSEYNVTVYEYAGH
jgi:hypothetical protein